MNFCQPPIPRGGSCVKLAGDVWKKASPPGISAPRQKRLGFPIANPGVAGTEKPGLNAARGWRGRGRRDSPGAPCGEPGSPGARGGPCRRAPPRPTLSPQPRGLPGFVVRPCGWAPAGGVVTSMCRQQPKVERACRASPETCLAMPCLCVCSNSRRAIRETAPRPDLADVFLFLFQPSG